MTDSLVGKLEALKLKRLIELKNAFPGDHRINPLGRRISECYIALNDINDSVCEAMASPDAKQALRAQIQEKKIGLKKMLDSLFQ